jgi:hypothetical protein
MLRPDEGGLMKMRPITIELVEEDAEALAEFAKEAGRSLEEFARDAVLDRLEDAQDLRDGMAAVEAFERSGDARSRSRRS